VQNLHPTMRRVLRLQSDFMNYQRHWHNENSTNALNN
jgi:hypothetical protein